MCSRAQRSSGDRYCMATSGVKDYKLSCLDTCSDDLAALSILPSRESEIVIWQCMKTHLSRAQYLAGTLWPAAVIVVPVSTVTCALVGRSSRFNDDIRPDGVLTGFLNRLAAGEHRFRHAGIARIFLEGDISRMYVLDKTFPLSSNGRYIGGCTGSNSNIHQTVHTWAGSKGARSLAPKNSRLPSHAARHAPEITRVDSALFPSA